MRRSNASRRAAKQTRKSGRPYLHGCESLERRTLLCGLSYDHLIEAPQWSDALEQQSVASRAAEGGPEATDIIWSNRGQASDGFTATFGTSAEAGRVVVDAALNHWERLITNWNRNDGTTTLQINISINGGGYGGAGAPANTAPADGKPTTGSFTITTGNVTADPNDSNGWYFDPQPNDWSEYDVPIDAFTGSSTTATGSDLYSLAVSEAAHVLGIISDKNNNGLAWNGYRLENMSTNTNIMDNTEGGGIYGRFYAFDGPTIDHAMTSYNSGDATNASWGNVIHTSGPGANFNFNIINWQTSEDVANANFDSGERTLPSWVTTHILGDAYGYTISEPQNFGTMYVSQNATTGLVTTRGGVGTSSDLVTVNAINILGIDFVTVAVDVGNDVPGTRHLPGAGNLPAWSTTYVAGAVSGIVINGGGGTDYLRLESTAGRPVTVNGGDGDDFIDFSFGNRNLGFINSNAHVTGGNGFDQIFVYDNNVSVGQSFTITSARFDRPGWGGFSYASDTENHVLTTGTGADTVNVQSTFTAQPVVVASAGGGDAVNIGNVFSGIQSISADVQIQNDPSFTTLQILNGPDSGARTWSIGISGAFGYLTGMAPADIYWDNFDIQAIGLLCGSGVDTGTILELSETLQINNTNGDNEDQITLGNGVSGVQQITGQVTIDNDPDFTNIIIDDTGDASARTVTLDFVSSYNVVSGLSPNLIRYDDFDTRNVTIRTGSATDTVNVLRTTSGGGTTTLNSSGGADAVHLGNTLTGVQEFVNTNIHVSNTPSFSTMSINNGPDTVGRNVTIDANPGVSQWINGLAAFSMISWNTNDVNAAVDIPITFGSGQDTINIARTLSRLSITTTDGADIATVGNNTNGCDNIQNSITFQNPLSFTSLTVNDTGNSTGRTWTIASSLGFGQLQMSLFLIISYKLADTSSPVTLNLGSGNDTVRVTGVDSRSLVLNGNGGNDTFEVGAPGTNVVDPINAGVTVNGGNDSDTLRFINSGDTSETGFSLNGNVASQGDMANVTFNTAESVEFFGGTGVFPLHVFQNVTPGIQLIMNAGPGYDVISVSNNPASALFIRPSGGFDDVQVNQAFNPAGAVVYINETTALGALNVYLNSRVVMPLSGAVLSVNSLFIDAASGQVDLYDNAMVWNYSGATPLATATNSVRTGFAGGAWVGPGIASSFAAATPGTGVGYGEASHIYTSFPASFAGVNVDNTSILFRTTLLGDANLNRTVNLDDFNIVATNFNTSGKVFTRGNFTYDAAGNVNLDDFNALASNFGSTLASTARGSTIRRDRRIGPAPTLQDLFADALIRASDASEEMVSLIS